MFLKVLFFGDIVGRIGREGLKKVLPELKKRYKPDLIIVNGENAAHGSGITKKIYQELTDNGIDFFTLGDHTFDRPEIAELLVDDNVNIIRPANYPPHLPGSGVKVIEVGSKKILLINLMGRVFMKMDYDCPFRKLDEILAAYKKENPSAIIVDFHAEVTSEKRAFGWYADGRVSAVLGTHTHIGTCDNQILPQGTAYITDVGMVGAKDSVIGVKKETIINIFLNQVSKAFELLETGNCIINAVLLKIDTKTKTAVLLKRVDEEVAV